jgi:predicted kinase
MENKQIVWILVGAPGSGKSTYGKTLTEGNSNIVRVCPDDNRRMIGGDSNNQAVSFPAFCMAKAQMRNALIAGKNVVFDATNMYRKARKDFINIARGHGAEACALVFEQTKATLLTRNAERGAAGGRNVGEKVIDEMLARYQRPDTTEFDKVTFITKVGV